jgi:hypothetical protein
MLPSLEISCLTLVSTTLLDWFLEVEFWLLPLRWPFAWVKSTAFWLHIPFVADDHEDHLRVAIDLGLFESSQNVYEWFSIYDIIDQSISRGWEIVSSRDRVEWLLPCLDISTCTVSYICNLMVLSPTVILASNFTPMVIFVLLPEAMVNELQEEARLSDTSNHIDFILVSAIMMNLNMYEKDILSDSRYNL